MKKIIVFVTTLLLVFVVFQNCNTPTTEQTKGNQEGLEALVLMEENCFSCHSPDASHENRIAPPMAAIKMHYLTEEITKEQFVEDIVAFVNNPTEESSKMPGALKRFGLMPKLTFSQDKIKQIAIYLFENEIEAPEWFAEHYQKMRKQYENSKMSDTLSYEEKGLKLAMATKTILGKNLLQAINTKGTEHAVTFCNTKAYFLTDSMSSALNAKIKRVSDLPRNANNQANQEELTQIMTFKQALAEGKKPMATVKEIDGKMIGYYAIETNKMCLQCHGKTNADIQPATLQKINALYPTDKAVGYAENELRGIWVVEMDKKE